MAAWGWMRLMIPAVRMLNSAVISGVLMVLSAKLGSFHTSQSWTLSLYRVTRAFTQRSYASRASGETGRPAPRLAPPPPS